MLKFSYTVGMPDTYGRMFAYQGDVDRFLSVLAELGYDAIEAFVRDVDALDLPWLERLLARTGLEVASVGTSPIATCDKLTLLDADAEVRAAAVARCKKHVDMAERFHSAVNIGRFRGTCPAEVPREISLARLHDALAELSEYAAKKNVRLSLEPQNRQNLNNLNSTREAADWLRAAGIPNLGLLLDTFHMYAEDPSMEAALVDAGDLLCYFHFADQNRGWPGSGAINFPNLLRVAASLGYDGYVTMEIAQLPDAETAARRSIEYLRGIAAAQQG